MEELLRSAEPNKSTEIIEEQDTNLDVSRLAAVIKASEAS
jgi:hypothetical protein